MHEEVELGKRKYLVAQQKVKLAESRQKSKVLLERSRLLLVQELRREENERREHI